MDKNLFLAVNDVVATNEEAEGEPEPVTGNMQPPPQQSGK